MTTTKDLTPEEQELADAIIQEMNQILDDARALQARALEVGCVLTIETAPNFPPAMGNYDIEFSLRWSNAAYRSGQ